VSIAKHGIRFFERFFWRDKKVFNPFYQIGYKAERERERKSMREIKRERERKEREK